MRMSSSKQGNQWFPRSDDNMSYSPIMTGAGADNQLLGISEKQKYITHNYFWTQLVDNPIDWQFLSCRHKLLICIQKYAINAS